MSLLRKEMAQKKERLIQDHQRSEKLQALAFENLETQNLAELER